MMKVQVNKLANNISIITNTDITILTIEEAELLIPLLKQAIIEAKITKKERKNLD